MAKYIWTDDSGQGLNRYALFRRTFELADGPVQGRLNIFADTRYRLLVNGVVLGHGPARFFVARPEYDSYDIAPFLNPGVNVVAVMVNSYGASNFHAERSIGGLIAWGQVSDDTGTAVGLATDGSWKAMESPGHRPDTSNISFALNQGELLDARRMPHGWELPDFDDADWPAAVPLADQDHWGELQERSIPPLDEREVLARRRLGTWVAGYADREHLYSFILMAPPGARRLRSQAGAAFTYLYSPRDQEVTLGAFWGSYWLNGEAIEPVPREDIDLRRDFRVKLRAGWNSLVVSEMPHCGAWEFYLGVPRGAGIEVSAEKEAGSPNTFLVAGPWACEDVAETQQSLAGVQSPEELPEDFGPWRPWPREMSAESPYFERSWKTFVPLHGGGTLTQDGADYAAVVGSDTLVLLYDFGGEVLGRPLLDFEAADGTVVDLTYTERLRDDGVAEHRGRHNVRMAERYIAREGRQRLHTFHPRGMRYLEVLVRGNLASFDLKKVALTRANYPVRRAGWFECSDPELNEIWALGPPALHECMEDAFLDCPWRERGLYSGDFLVQFHSNLAVYGDTDLFRRCIELFLLSQDESGFIAAGAHGIKPGRHPDYTAVLVQGLWRYWACTGDTDFLERARPRLEKLMQALAGLKLPAGDLLDGSDLHPYLDLGRMDRSGINCTLNCFYQRAFHDAARIMDVLGDGAASEGYRAQAEALAAAVRREFWDEERGVFTDRRSGDVPTPQPSVQANSLALLYDIADEEQAPRALDYLTRAMLSNFRVPEPQRNDDCNVAPYFSFYALGALLRYGRVAEAQQFIKDCWGRMVRHGAWTTWEFFVDDASWCHAWATSPTHYLSTEILGVSFPEPGDRNVVRVEPRPGSLTWAAGAYPHPEGPIRVRWEAKGGCLLLEIEAPEAVHVQVNEEACGP